MNRKIRRSVNVAEAELCGATQAQINKLLDQYFYGDDEREHFPAIESVSFFALSTLLDPRFKATVCAFYFMVFFYNIKHKFHFFQKFFDITCAEHAKYQLINEVKKVLLSQNEVINNDFIKGPLSKKAKKDM